MDLYRDAGRPPRSAERAELSLYPGDQHLFADTSLPAYDDEAATLLRRRVLSFLEGLDSSSTAPGSRADGSVPTTDVAARRPSYLRWADRLSAPHRPDVACTGGPCVTPTPTNPAPAPAPETLPPPSGPASELAPPDGAVAPAADAPADGAVAPAADTPADGAAAPVAPGSLAPPSGGRQKFPWWIIAVAAALVAVVGVVIFVVTRDGGDDAVVAPPPNVVNVAGTAAIQALNNAGFTTDPAVASVNPCDAPVASQATDGTTVTLTFAPCNQVRTVVNLVGQRANTVRGFVPRLGFQLEVVVAGTSATCNPAVVAQAPAPGTRTNRDSTMVISIPAEPDGCGIVNTLPPENGRTAAFFGPIGA